jgi:hypothetical protein
MPDPKVNTEQSAEAEVAEVFEAGGKPVPAEDGTALSGVEIQRLVEPVVEKQDKETEGSKSKEETVKPAVDTDTRKFADKYDSVEALEKAHKELGSVANKWETELSEVKNQLVDQDGLQQALDKLEVAIATSDDTAEIRTALFEAQRRSGKIAFDPSKVDPQTGQEISGAMQAYFAKLEEKIVKLEGAVTQKNTAEENAALETEYPFASTIKDDGSKIMQRFVAGEITEDQVAMEFAKIGYDAHGKGDVARTTVKDRDGSDAPGKAGMVVETPAEKTPEQEAETEMTNIFKEGLRGPPAFTK